MRYAVKAVRGQAVVDLQLEAPDLLAAREEALRQGYSVLSVKGEPGLRNLAAGRRFPTTLFSIQLVSLLDAGLNLVEALQALASKEQRAWMRRVTGGLLSALRAGESFSQALARFPEQFPPIYAAVVRASERTGDLQRALLRYIEYEQKFERVRKKLVSALLYPAVLVIVGTLVLMFLVFYVVPRFSRVYENLSQELPFFSGLLLAAGAWIERHGWITLGLAATTAALAACGLSRRRVRSRLLAQLWRIPQLGEKMKIYQLARLYGTLGMLLRSGVAVVPSIDMTAGLLPAHLRLQLARARTLIEQGQSISSAMAAAGLSTAVADQMMAVGERSGQMGQMMERVASFYDDDLSRWIDWAMRLFEPVLMAAIGVAIGLVVVLMYMPVFELAGSLQ